MDKTGMISRRRLILSYMIYLVIFNMTEISCKEFGEKVKWTNKGNHKHVKAGG